MNTKRHVMYWRVIGLLLLVLLSGKNEAVSQVENPATIAAVLKAIPAAKTDSARAVLYLKLAQAATLENYVDAAGYALKAVEYAEKGNPSSWMYEVYATAGEIFLNTGNNDIAADFFARYVDLARSMHDSVALAAGYFNLGSVWLVMGEYDKAEKMMVTMEEIQYGHLRRYGDPIDTTNMLSVYNNMLMLKAEQRAWEDGKRYFEKGKRLVEGHEDYLFLLGMLYINYGDLLLNKGDTQQAIRLYESAREIFVRTEDKAREAVSEACLGNAYEKTGEFNRAIDTYRRVYLSSQQLQNDHLGQTASQGLYRLYKETALKDSTLKYLTIAREFDEKIKADQAREKLIAKELSWKFEEMQQMQESAYNASLGKIIIGLILAGLLAFGLVLLVGKKHQRLKQVNLEKLQLALDTQKLQLDKELLVAQVELKDKQLATEVLYRVQNHELIKEVVQKLIAVQAKSTKETKETLGSVLKGLEKSLEDKAWDDFEMRFQQVHPNFYEKLQRDFPDLSLNERRLCAFLKLNMTTKEISAITGQSVNSIQVARWRLRKKLNLQDADAALTDFFTRY